MTGMGKPGDQQTWVYQKTPDQWAGGSTGGGGGSGSIGTVIPGYPNANYAFVTSSNQWNIPAGSVFVGEPNLTASITTTGSPVMILVNANYTSQNGNSQGIFSLTKGGVNLGHAQWGMMAAGPLQQSYNNSVSICYVDFPPAGTYSYSLVGCNPTGSGLLTAYGVGPAALMLFEMKNANVVTGSSFTSQSVPGGTVTIPGLSASIFVNRGPILAMANISLSSDNANNWAWGTINRDGVNQGAGNGLVLSVGSQANEYMQFSMMVMDQGASTGASHTYTLAATNGAGTNTLAKNGQFATIILWELTDVNWKYSTSTSNPSTGGSYTDMVPATPNPALITRGRPVLLISDLNMNTNGSTGRTGHSFLRNGASVTSGTKGLQLVDGEGSGDWNRVPTMYWFDTVTAGTYIYQDAGITISGSSFPAQGPTLSTFLMYELDGGLQNGNVFGGWLDNNNTLSTTASVKVGGSETVLGAMLVSGNLLVSGSATVLGPTFLSGSLFVSGSETVLGNMFLSSSLLVSGSETVRGPTFLSGTLFVSGSTTMLGPAFLSSSLLVSGSATVLGPTFLSGTLFVSGSATVLGAMFLSSSLLVSGSETVLGNMLLSGTMLVSSSLTVLGAMSGSAGKHYTLPLANGVFSTGTDGSNPKTIGGIAFTPANWPDLTNGSTITLHMLLETTSITNQVTGTLFQFSGPGSPQVIATLITSSLNPVELTANVSSFFRPNQGGIFLSRIALGTNNGTDAATSVGSWLEISP